MPSDVVTKEFYDVISPEDIELLKKFDELEKRVKVVKDTLKANGYEFLEKNNLLDVGYEQDGVVLSYKRPYTKKMVDTQAMKDQGLYDDFLKDVEVKGSVSITVKYEDD
ncbi:MAG: hypothetical protein IKE23_05155 [Exiguobacterium sp.]|nr:hypothetical protein [Exiguobacterium sp.]